MVRNTVANGAGAVAGVLITLVMTPLLIDRLGTEAYGIWILATTLTFGFGYLSFADLGFEQAAARYVAIARADGDIEQMNRVLSTGFFILAAIGLVLTPIFMALAVPLVDLFNVPEDMRHEATWAFALVMAQLAFELPGRGFASALEGAQRFGVLQIVRLVQGILIAVAMAVTVLTGNGIAVLGAATLGATIAVFVLGWVAMRLAVPDARITPRLFSRTVVRELWHFGSRLFGFRLLSSVYRQLDKTIIGVALAASFVTTYEVANKLYGSAALVQSLATSSLVPAVAYSRANAEKLRAILLRGSNYTLAIALPVTLAGIIFASPLIRTWIGESQVQAALPAQLLLLSLAPGFLIAVGQTMLVALGRMNELLILAALWTAINVGLSIWFVQMWEINGVIVATLIATVALVPPNIWLFLDELDVSLWLWNRAVVLPVIPGLVVQGAVGYGLLQLADDSGSLVVVALLGSVSIAVAYAVYWFVGLDGPHRAALTQTIRRTVGLEHDVTAPR
ncbi:hypothetical protein DSM104329_05140 [Capillimicrobium parvum]|uniref:Polysaccharide biosynthesis protein C-terminal domain-containing protein n=1 Tax=Capillimicrobium parvum TaxID=2884022 RepID=A0A9E6Y2B5_9ACTN|nr:hypothetical protein DSM104329_05140 [Capillimicrobium parvum]